VLQRLLAADDRADIDSALEWTQALMPDLANLRAALRWARGPQGEVAMAVALAGAAGSFWALVTLDHDAAPPLLELASAVHDPLPRALQLRFWLAVALRHADSRFSWDETLAAAQRAVKLAREEVARDAAAIPLLLRALYVRLPLAQRACQPEDAQADAAEMRALEAPDWSAPQRRLRRWCEHWELYQRGDWSTYAQAQRLELVLMNEAGDRQRAWSTAHRLALADIACGRAAEAVQVMQAASARPACCAAAGNKWRCWQWPGSKPRVRRPRRCMRRCA
jgi:hypothetical protein